MNLDIRIPIGLLFAVLGAILAIFGLVAEKVVDPAIYLKSLGYNVNLWWGLVMFIFGVVMLLLGRSGTSSVHSSGEKPPADDPERMHRTTTIWNPQDSTR